MKQKILDKLYEELDRAREKESLASKENAATEPGDQYQIAVKFSELTKAQGYTNATLRAIDLVQITKED